jgi:hypothetical protein
MKRHESREPILKEALEHAPVIQRVPKTHKEIVNKISNRKFR